jgi:dTDP-4-dehydrorhamnose reductase
LTGSPRKALKILLFGKNGQLGWELQRSLASLGELTALGHDSAGLCGDLADIDGITRTVERVQPDVIVNAAAYTAVDKAESEPALAHAVNALAPGALARAANRIGALLVHYSTDYVFDGSGERPWKENDPTGPLCVYGQSKLDGERLIVAACDRHLIFRTGWVYARRGKNFVATILRLANERDHLTVVDDRFGAPTGADLLADVTAHAIRAVLDQPHKAGTYHLAASGSTSWHGYASFIVDAAARAGRALKTSPGNVEPVPSSAFPAAARRPNNSRLDTSRLGEAFGLVPPPWQSGVAHVLDEMMVDR